MSNDNSKVPMQATPHGTLLEQIIDPCQPKNEREWAASREIERLTALTKEYRENGDRLMRVADEYKAECERHIQEVDASREAIERKDAALRVALAELERLDKDSPFPIGVKAIPIIKEAL